ncbi:MAG: 2OG-Fe(II) oxygenase [Pseudomonadales bacterium]
MKFLNDERFAELLTTNFRETVPYPWSNPGELLTDEGHRMFVARAPDTALFRKVFGKSRRYGQASHDRYVLDYADSLPIEPCWHALVAELRGSGYRDFIRQLFGVRDFNMQLHWHYTPDGCSVSPHCDAERKIGSHIFYLNTSDSWLPEWGGQTVILDDGGRFDPRSAPAFEDFQRQIPVVSVDNHSLIFARAGHSWHGVRPIRCPPDRFRKAFIVVFEKQKRSSWRGAIDRLGLRRSA